MACHNGSFKAWVAGLVSGIDKLNVTADSTYADFGRWKLGIFKVFEEQGILHYVDGTSFLCPYIFAPPDVEKTLAVALLLMTMDDKVKDKLYTLDNPLRIYEQLRDNYLTYIEEERSLQARWEDSRLEMRQVHTEKKESLEETIKQKKEELAELEIEVAALEKAIEQTYAPEWIPYLL